MEASLMALPLEVRIAIYKDVFSDRHSVKLAHQSPKSVSKAGSFELVSCTRNRGSRLRRFHSAILRTCRQAYHEGLGLLYADKVFSCSFEQFQRTFHTKNRIRIFPEQNLRMIQPFQLCVTEDVQYKICPSTIAQVIALLPALLKIMSQPLILPTTVLYECIYTACNPPSIKTMEHSYILTISTYLIYSISLPVCFATTSS